MSRSLILRSAVFGLVSVALAGVGATAPATATPAQSKAVAGVAPGAYTIRALHSGKCFAPQDGSTSDGVLIVQQTCDGSAAQRVTLQQFTDPNHPQRFRFVTGAGKCWNVEGGSPLPYKRIIQYPCQAVYNEAFDLHGYHPWGGSQIAPLNHNSFCLHVRNATTADGADIIQLPCNVPGSGARNDTFTFVPA
ncbi:RICIN domain-containing protein [Streptomyces sp. NPDC006798]|uniref:RICIN domain-containing protein n=1 Tax=Streptomyces sp. NPDC006798 TaxID=3155462 RepID=UPI0033D1BF96